jgi:hypothetical protein
MRNLLVKHLGCRRLSIDSNPNKSVSMSWSNIIIRTSINNLQRNPFSSARPKHLPDKKSIMTNNLSPNLQMRGPTGCQLSYHNHGFTSMTNKKCNNHHIHIVNHTINQMSPLKRLQILPIKQDMKSVKEPNRFNQVTARQNRLRLPKKYEIPK